MQLTQVEKRDIRVGLCARQRELHSRIKRLDSTIDENPTRRVLGTIAIKHKSCDELERINNLLQGKFLAI